MCIIQLTAKHIFACTVDFLILLLSFVGNIFPQISGEF